MLHQLMFLATEGAEGLSGDHIAAKLAVPLGIIIFCGSVYMLLWSNYGAKKGALIYGTAAGGFCFMLGIFWWFGAPGTPTATGLQNFPGQTPDAYTAAWYTFEPGSARAASFPKSDNLEANFTSAAEYLGKQDLSQDDLESDPKYSFVKGELDQAGQLMTAFALREDLGGPGGQQRAAWQETGAAGLAAQVSDPGAYKRADTFFTAGIDGSVHATKDAGVLVAGATVVTSVNYDRDDAALTAAGVTDLDAVGPAAVAIEVDRAPYFAFQKPSLLWYPSAVWTAVAFLLLVGSLFGLDRIEQREKRQQADVEQPERLAVPIKQ